MENLLGPVSTRNLLVCFLWVIRSIDKELLSNWWFTLSITRLDALLNVLDLCVSCFEYRVSMESLCNCRERKKAASREEEVGVGGEGGREEESWFESTKFNTTSS